MPDPLKQTISATESPALFNVSPWTTRWMLFQKFARGVDIDPEEDVRMTWGKKLEPLVMQHAAEELRLEARPNAATYHRRGRLGCTRDATIICPDRGPGALEVKCVFDYRTWMQDWQGGKAPPRHYDIQLQQQMCVGDEVTPFEWGVLAAWVAGEVYYFERKPIPDLWEKLETEARTFFWEVEEDLEPNPFGAPVELPWLTALFPTVAGNPLDLTAEPGAEAHIETAIRYSMAKAQESAGKGEAEPLRAKLLALAKDHDEVLLPARVTVRVRPHGKGKRVTVYVPDDAPISLSSEQKIPIEELIYAG